MTRRPDRKDVATVDELHASATKLVGLDDFGTDDDNYREALGVLLDAYQGEAGLTVLGSKMNRFFLRGALVARLLSQSAWKQYPEHVDVAIKRPIFVPALRVDAVRRGSTGNDNRPRREPERCPGPKAFLFVG